MDEDALSKFWSFSIDFYGRTGVSEVCLELQDFHDVDVNLVLYVLWRGLQGIELDRSAIADLDNSLSPWRHNVVEPLRKIRRQLKELDTDLGSKDVNDLRNSVKDLELKSEFLAQKLLVKKIDTGINSRQAVGTITRGNLQAYGEFLCRTLPEELCEKLISNLG
ncbi:MAG: TIGR02444 family protein [Methyloligellaceae bacterium]